MVFYTSMNPCFKYANFIFQLYMICYIHVWHNLRPFKLFFNILVNGRILRITYILKIYKLIHPFKDLLIFFGCGSFSPRTFVTNHRINTMRLLQLSLIYLSVTLLISNRAFTCRKFSIYFFRRVLKCLWYSNPKLWSKRFKTIHGGSFYNSRNLI